MQSTVTLSIPTNFNLSRLSKKNPHIFLPKKEIFVGKGNSFCGPSMASSIGGFRVSSQMGGAGGGGGDDSGFCTLMEYVGKGGADVGDDLVVLFAHLQYAAKRIAALVASPFNSSLGKQAGIGSGSDSMPLSRLISSRMRSLCLLCEILVKLQLWLQKKMMSQSG